MIDQQIEEIQIEAKAIYNRKLTEFVAYYTQDKSLLNECMALASEAGFLLDYCFVLVDGLCLVNVEVLPDELQFSLAHSNDLALDENRFVPITSLIGAIQTVNDKKLSEYGLD